MRQALKMKLSDKDGSSQHLSSEIARNLLPGCTVALVSVPLSISLSIAGGGTPVQGVITSIWAGVMECLVGGSHFNILGPTGALSGILITFAHSEGNQHLGILAVASGLFCFVVYLLRLEKFIILPTSVVEGFTLGIGVIILVGQLKYGLGLLSLQKRKGLIANFLEAMYHIEDTDYTSALLTLIGIIFLFIMYAWRPHFPHMMILALFGIVCGYLSKIGYFFGLEIYTLKTVFGDIEASIFNPPPWPDLDSSPTLTGSIFSTGISVAFVVVLQTMLCAKIAAERAETEFGPEAQQWELLSCALTNITTGLTGGIPASGALARTALNVVSGATSRISGLIQAFAVAVVSMVILPWFSFLPLSVIAAILFRVSYFMCEGSLKKTHSMMQTKHYFDFSLTLIVAALCAVWDPVVGLSTGAIVGLFTHAKSLAPGFAEVKAPNKEAAAPNEYKALENSSSSAKEKTSEVGEWLVYRLIGSLDYVNKEQHLQELERVCRSEESVVGVRLDMSDIFHIDFDGLEALKGMVECVRAKQLRCSLDGMKAEISQELERHTSWYPQLLTSK